MTIVPAYGRDYKSARAAKDDWTAGKDFLIADMSSPHDGRYVNVKDYGGRVTIRYAGLTKVTVG